VEEHLRDLAMEKAIVSSEIEEAEPGPTGFDVLTFLMSANPGEPPKPLHKVASGGEISRVMLAIKAAGARSSGVPTLIFDEIDTGISGKAAAAMGQKLRDLSRDFQIIVISHLPQIASCADHHLLIEKTEQRGRVVTQIRVLSDDERVLEVARMLAGNQIGDAALANARELVAKSRASAL
jgi:DNA repair protein RecN (Recombination protein N)